MSIYVSIKVGLFKVFYSNGATIGYTWSSLSVNGVSSSWTGGLDRWAIVEKSIHLYVYLISRTFECISLQLTHLLAK